MIPALRRTLVLAALLCAIGLPPLAADEDVLLQGFYWDCPEGWYSLLRKQVPNLAKAGFTAIWLPPPAKGAGGRWSMGYDVYDHYDLGSFKQKGTVATRFGTQSQLKSLLREIHRKGLEAYADVVLNHMIGGELEDNPVAGEKTWTRFRYRHRKFEKDWRFFHPNEVHRDNLPPYQERAFGEDLCQDYAPCAQGLKEWGDWLTAIGYDGYRLDFVKGMRAEFVRDWLAYGRMRGKFAVGEYWDADVDALAAWSQVTGASVFDFPLFYLLKDLCNDGSGGFDLRRLAGAGFIARDPLRAVTFVENHDTDRNDPVFRDKMLAYAFILTMEGYPCVFYKDYAVYGLASGIDRLISIRKRLAGGGTTVLRAEPDLWIAQRNGFGELPGCVLVLNDHPTEWKGAWVTVKWPSQELADHTGRAHSQRVAADGRVQLWAPPRGYAVYGPGLPPGGGN